MVDNDSGSRVIDFAAHYLPFVGLVVGKAPVNRPMLTRVMEQALVGIIASAATLYANDKVQDMQLSGMKAEMIQIHDEIRQMRSDLYIPRAERKD